MLNKLLLSLLIMTLFSCNKNQPEDYKNNSPTLDIREYLNGKIKAWGIVESRSGKIIRRFTVNMNGSWKNNEGILDEYFKFDDGELSERKWKIKFKNNHEFTATADDVIGVAKGKQFGNSLQMKYVLDLKMDNGKSYKVNLDDWMYLIDEKTLINKSKIKKFGINFAYLTIMFQKIDG